MKSKANIIIGVLVLAGGIFAYSFLSGGESEAQLAPQAPILSQNVKGRDLLKVLLSLDSIKLDEEIFSSPLFTSLEDFTLVLPTTGTTGRKNPFAPIGAE